MTGAEVVAEEFVKKLIKEGWIKKAFSFFRKKHRFLLLGSTGVGKTNLLKSFQSDTPEVIYYLNRTEFAKKSKAKIESEPFIFIDTPGQIDHKPRRIREIRMAMSRGISGIINVVAYGYHEHKKGLK